MSILVKRMLPELTGILKNILKLLGETLPRKKYLKAQIELVEGNYLDAKYLLMEASLDSQTPSIKISTLMSRCLLELGDFQGVINLLKRVKKNYPKNIQLLGLLAKAYIRLGDLENACEVIDEALALDRGHPWVRHTAAKIHLAQQNIKAARSMLEDRDIEAMSKDCNNLAIRYFENKWKSEEFACLEH